MRAIFISYRREDAEGQAGRLFDDLVGHFGENAVFMDVAGIEPGRDFRRVIDDNVATCGVLLAVIGKDWLDAKDQAGRRRLEDPGDFVRLETASALKRDIPVIPVLVQGAKMPRAEQLPADLTDLVYRNAVELTHARWDSDVQLLIKTLGSVGGSTPPPRVSRRAPVVAALALLAVVIGGYSWYALRSSPVNANDQTGLTAGSNPNPAEQTPGQATVPTEEPSAEPEISGEPSADPPTQPTPKAIIRTSVAGIGDSTPPDQSPITTPERTKESPARPLPGGTTPVITAAAPIAPAVIPAAGDMLFYRHGGVGQGLANWPVQGKEIGTGWNFKQVFAGDNGAIYAIKNDGTMLFYRHRGIADGSPDWPIQANVIGSGWNFKQVFAGDNGAVYAIKDDGTMLFYKHRGIADGSPDWPIQANVIGSGWNFKQVFAGDNGAVYAIKDDGTMLFYKHRGIADGSPDWPIQANVIGSGWNFKQVFAGDNGAVYAITNDGRMLFYNHSGIADGSADWSVQGEEIGTGWNFRHVFASSGGAIYAIK